VADECDSADKRPVGHRRCQRRDDETTVPRTSAAAVAVRTGDIPDDALDGTLDNAPPNDDDPNTAYDPAAPNWGWGWRKGDARRGTGVAGRTAAG